MNTTPLNISVVREKLENRQSEGFKKWTLDFEAPSLVSTFIFPDFLSALDFVNKVGEISERENHHPDVYLSWGKVELRFSTHSAKAITELDFRLMDLVNRLIQTAES